MTSWWGRWRIQSPTSRSLFTQPFVQAQIKENIKAPRHWPLCGGNSPVTGEFPAQRASNAENVSIWWRHHESYSHQAEAVKQSKLWSVTELTLTSVHPANRSTGGSISSVHVYLPECKQSREHELPNVPVVSLFCIHWPWTAALGMGDWPQD